MIQSIVIGKVRKTGRDEILADRTVPYARQKELYEAHAVVSEKYETVALVSLEPMKRVFNPKPKTETVKNKNENEN